MCVSITFLPRIAAQLCGGMLQSVCVRVSGHIYVYIYIYIYIYMSIYTHTQRLKHPPTKLRRKSWQKGDRYTHSRTHKCTYTHKQTHIHKRTHLYTRTYTHTHTHTPRARHTFKGFLVPYFCACMYVHVHMCVC